MSTRLIHPIGNLQSNNILLIFHLPISQCCFTRASRALPRVNVRDSFGICVTIGRMIQASANGTSRERVSDSHWM